jgi:hypothetical protein
LMVTGGMPASSPWTTGTSDLFDSKNSHGEFLAVLLKLDNILRPYFYCLKRFN